MEVCTRVRVETAPQRLLEQMHGLHIFVQILRTVDNRLQDATAHVLPPSHIQEYRKEAINAHAKEH